MNSHHPHRIADVSELFSRVRPHRFLGNCRADIDQITAIPVPRDDVFVVAREPKRTSFELGEPGVQWFQEL